MITKKLFLNFFIIFIAFYPTAMALGYDASYVLGQPDFTSSDVLNSQSGISSPGGMHYDQESRLLFLVDQGNNRVLIFDLSGGITNGQNATYVLGQPDFTSNTPSLTQNGFNSPKDVFYDNQSELLFVSDTMNARVLIFDLSGGITNGQNATYVLGQPDFTSNMADISQNNFSIVTGIFYKNGLLFIGEADTANRILVFDISGGITNGQNATYVLGQPDFISSGGVPLSASKIFSTINGQVYLDSNDLLYVADGGRVLIFDLSGGITNGQDAVNVLGQPDFTTLPLGGTSISEFTVITGVAMDEENQILFLSDWLNSRILLFDLSGGITDGQDATSLIGQIDFDSADSGTTSSLFNFTGIIFFDSENRMLYVADDFNNRVLVFEFVKILDGSALPSGVVGSSYTKIFSTDYDQGTVEYSLISGVLPPGLSLNSNGTLSGIPTVAGNYNFTLRATDVMIDGIQEFFDTKSFSLTIDPFNPEEVDDVSTSTSSGSMLPRMMINNNEKYTTSNIVTLNKMYLGGVGSYSVSRTPDFSNSEIKQFNFGIDSPDSAFDICQGLNYCPSGIYKAYVRFYSFNGSVISEASDDIYYQSCPAFSGYLKMNSKNDKNEVAKVQRFLNITMNAGLAVDSVFGPSTHNAVKAFQLKYADQVLHPWGLKNPTGWWYKTTNSWANYLYGCSVGNIFLERVNKDFKHPDPDPLVFDAFLEGPKIIFSNMYIGYQEQGDGGGRNMMVASLLFLGKNTGGLFMFLIALVLCLIIIKVYIDRKRKKETEDIYRFYQ